MTNFTKIINRNEKELRVWAIEFLEGDDQKLTELEIMYKNIQKRLIREIIAKLKEEDENKWDDVKHCVCLRAVVDELEKDYEEI